MKVTRIEVGFFEKRGDIAHEVLNEVFEIEGASKDDVVAEDGNIRPEIKLALLTIADISAEEYGEFAYDVTKITEYERE